MTRRVVAGLMALALSLIPLHVLAHAELLEADPRPGSTISHLTEIRLTFSQPLIPDSNLRLYAAGFQAMRDVTPIIEGAIMRAALPRSLTPGDYTVQWIAVSTDGHITEGSYQFRMAESNGAPIWMWGLGGLGVVAAAGLLILLNRRRRSAA
jgi:methionine-rich copper-binding protein CopC